MVAGSTDDVVSLADSFLAGGESPPLHPDTTVRLARAVIKLRSEIDAVDAALDMGGIERAFDRYQKRPATRLQRIDHAIATRSALRAELDDARDRIEELEGETEVLSVARDAATSNAEHYETRTGRPAPPVRRPPAGPRSAAGRHRHERSQDPRRRARASARPLLIRSRIQPVAGSRSPAARWRRRRSSRSTCRSRCSAP